MSEEDPNSESVSKEDESYDMENNSVPPSPVNDITSLETDQMNSDSRKANGATAMS